MEQIELIMVLGLVIINDDGLIDILYSEVGEFDKVWLNNGTGWTLDGRSIPYDFGGDFKDKDKRGARLIDVNSDSLSDIVWADEYEDKANNRPPETWINNGNSWSKKDEWALPVYLTWENGAYLHDDSEVRFVDLNLDGLVDILQSDSVNKAWINNGSGWVKDNSWWPGTVDFYGGPGDGSSDGDHGWRMGDINGDGMVDFLKSRNSHTDKALINTNGNTWQDVSSWFNSEDFVNNFGGLDSGARLYDINGDGLLDIVGDGHDVKLNDNTLAYFLTEVHNGIGGVLKINYSRATKFDNKNKLGFNVWVVSSLENNNGVTGAHSLEPITMYNYSGGFYDEEDDEFRGFENVNETIEDKVTANTYFQDDAKYGLIDISSIYDTLGNLYRKINYTYSEYSPVAYNYYEVLLEKVEEFIFSGESYKEKETKYSYDNNGNVIYVYEKGDVDNLDDDKFSYFEFLNNNELWIVDKVSREYVLDSDNFTILQEVNYSYDGLDYGEIPLYGKVTKEEQWNSEGENVVIERGYNVKGNLVNFTDSLGNFEEYEYEDSEVFIDKKIDSKGFINEYDYDLGIGKLNWVKDSSGVYTNYSYDVFGRVTKEIEVYDSLSYPTKEYTYFFDGVAPEGVKISVREDSGESGEYSEYYFYDGFGNVIQGKLDARDGKQRVYDLFYDNLSRVIKESNGYFVTASSGYSEADVNVSGVSYEYDVLDRIVRVINGDSTFSNNTYGVWNLTTYDEKKNRIDYDFNSRGDIIKITEHNNGEEYFTTYDYDVLGNLISIVDNEGNVFNFSYDSLGRKVGEIDPDLGEIIYSYDLNGNLVSENRSHGGLVSDGDYNYEYNSLGQLVNVSLVNGTLVEEYTYDGNGDRIKSYNYLTNTTIYTPFREFMVVVNSSGSYNFTYVYEGNVLVARINPDDSKWFYHPDHLGSTTLITGEGGNLVSDLSYYPYGSVLEGDSSEVKLYENKIFGKSGLYYYNARYYDPNKRIFTRADSMLPEVYDPQQLNRYSFERGNPYSYTDPDGHRIIGDPISDFLDRHETAQGVYFMGGVNDEVNKLLDNKRVKDVKRILAVIPKVNVISAILFSSTEIGSSTTDYYTETLSNRYAKMGVSGFKENLNTKDSLYEIGFASADTALAIASKTETGGQTIQQISKANSITEVMFGQGIFETIKDIFDSVNLFGGKED